MARSGSSMAGSRSSVGRADASRSAAANDEQDAHSFPSQNCLRALIKCKRACGSETGTLEKTSGTKESERWEEGRRTTGSRKDTT